MPEIMTSDATPRCANCGKIDEYATFEHRATHGDRVYYCDERCRMADQESGFAARVKGADVGYDPDNTGSFY